MTKAKPAFAEIPNCSFETELARRLRAGEQVSDAEFDQLYPGRLRLLSSIHWTPVNIAIRAAALATSEGQERVLDIGSGVGKFCTIGALTTKATFVGIEQREHLVDLANDVSSRLGIANVRYFHMNAVDVDWTEFPSIYLFNPFSEHIDNSIHIDELCEFSANLYFKYLEHTQWQLAETRTGTRVIIYNRFGGEFPPGFECVHREEFDFLPLEIWRKK